MVSKRTVDALRLHLNQSGHSDIPTQNDRLFDVLHEHGILVPCNDRAIWRAEVKGDGWAHELTLIRTPASRVWSDPSRWPDEFLGTVTPIASPESHTPVNIDHGAQVANSASLLSAPDMRVSKSVDAALASSPNQPNYSPEQPHHPAEHSPSASISDDPGEAFLSWLVDGIASRKIDYNNPGTRIHVVPEGVWLVSPGLFQDYAKACDSIMSVVDHQTKICYTQKK